MASNDPNSSGQYYYDGLMARGYSPMQAAVLAGNMEQESGFDPTRVNAPEGAFGSLQWRQDRLAGLQNYAGSMGKSSTDPDVQMDYIVKEMQGPESKTALPFLNATDPQSANAALKGYIRYGDGSQPTRLKYAMAFLPAAANGNAASASSSDRQAGNAPPVPLAPQQSTAAAPGGSPSRQQFLSQWGVMAPPANDSTAPTSASSSPAASPAASAQPSGASPDRAAFLQSWGAGSTAPAAATTGTTAQPPATSQQIATGPGIYNGKPVTPGAAGNNPMAIARPNPEQVVGDRAADLRAATEAPSATGYTPSSVPWLDPVAAFADSAINSIPVVGNPLMQGITRMDAGINNLLGFQTETPDQRGAIINATNAQYPGASIAGAVTGTVAPFLAVGPETLAAKALGTASDYGYGTLGNIGARALAGGASGAALSGADTATRGGDLNAIGQNMLIGAGVGAAAAPVMHAIGNAGAAVGRWFQGGASAPETLSNALMQDRIPPQKVNALVGNMGPGAMVADIGPSTQKLAARLAGQPGDGQAIVRSGMEARAANANGRLDNAVGATLGQGQPVGSVTDQVLAQQAAAADPLYTAVRKVPVQMTPELQDIASRPMGQEAFDTAHKMMANDGVPTTQPPMTQQQIASKILSGEISPDVGEQMFKNPQSTGSSQPTVGLLDYAKRALDDMASAANQAGENNKARQAGNLAQALRDAVDTQIGGAPGKGAYAQARDAFAGPARVIDAIRTGQDIFTTKMSPEQLQSTLAGMSASEKDGLLAGAQDAVQQKIGNARTDAQGVRSAFQSSNAKEKLGMLIGPQQAQALSDAIDNHAALSSTENAVSKSVDKASDDFASSAVGPVAASNVSIKGLAKLIDVPALFMKARNSYANSYRTKQNGLLANMLMSPGLSADDAAAVANANHPVGGGVPGAAVALAAKNTQPGPSNALFNPGVGGPDMVYRDGKWIPRVYVRGASVIGQ